ncbi:MAG: hypothetical protein A2Y45_02465 [Tenericutes bacterium GWC2_34_14]|nr:MAG: hypothetical protein A2Z84_05300 [Tenericutes bacterium GWA2_35_7]OHE28100.1 MAG: hypothetical protein A2Y45_02465 [Tenericutes bacterium GWC2_34_14]OHE32960.1 MAG: hypothetical protein A2012_09765 [Tenericutes bacterium GWE2_34_108]OHE36075.1 MAG: hypothetical protein A2Y46_06645 [Tenericutes bacterium GWF1_35_14]OHE39298.1 MAG: hypothetical protein A2Y44_06005 [Tenericutes bacterium GWF2_35_184]OHE44572.1 MAG: hypothetical protein A2221_01840 [Tenericutes bacterium RIFOXYA2_FULL_36_3
MKKISMIFVLLMIGLLVSACTQKESPIVISKIFETTVQADNMIELYNPSDEDIDLKDYHFNFYTNGSLEVSQTIQLEGTINANDYFLIGSGNSTNTTITSQFDFSNPDAVLPFNGNDGIELMYKKAVVDYIGQVGSDVDIYNDLTMIRLGLVEDYKPSKTFNTFDYIYYLPEVFQYIKNDDYEIKTLDDLYAGPRLEQRYKDMPYVDSSNENIGGGGAVLTSVSGIADGDTAYFNANNGFGGGSVRYFYLNTAEVNGSHVSAEPWGYVASKYNKEFLLNDANQKEIHVQSIPGYALNEGYGRYLGLVWINGYLSQFLIVSEGLSEDVGSTYNAYDLALNYKDVPYLTFLRFAEYRARLNGWGLKGYPANPSGEKSPDWNYDSNTLTTEKPVWSPHLDLPWA